MAFWAQSVRCTVIAALITLFYVTFWSVLPRLLISKRWILPGTKDTFITKDSVTISDVKHASFDKTVYLTVRLSPGRLGNDLFRCAALIGIANMNGMTPFVVSPTDKVEMFKSTFVLTESLTDAITASNAESRTFNTFLEERAEAYDKRVENLNFTDTRIRKYFQSYKYFSHIEDDIRQAFTFRNDVLSKALAFFKTISVPDDVTYVGVHIRRNAMTKAKTTEFGYVSPPLSYYHDTMAYFRNQFENVIFVMCSDDPSWSQHNLAANRSDVVVAMDNSPQTDLAILSLCNHTIMSAGTFGWWAAWLAEGQTVYYKDYPRPGSLLDKITVREDYYPPEWIGM